MLSVNNRWRLLKNKHAIVYLYANEDHGKTESTLRTIIKSVHTAVVSLKKSPSVPNQGQDYISSST